MTRPTSETLDRKKVSDGGTARIHAAVIAHKKEAFADGAVNVVTVATTKGATEWNIGIAPLPQRNEMNPRATPKADVDRGGDRKDRDLNHRVGANCR